MVTASTGWPDKSTDSDEIMTLSKLQALWDIAVSKWDSSSAEDYLNNWVREFSWNAIYLVTIWVNPTILSEKINELQRRIDAWTIIVLSPGWTITIEHLTQHGLNLESIQELFQWSNIDDLIADNKDQILKILHWLRHITLLPWETIEKMALSPRNDWDNTIH